MYLPPPASPSPFTVTVADSGTKRLPLGSFITYISPPTLDAVANVEVKHHVQRRSRVAAEHFHQGRPLPGRDRRERVGEELPAAKQPWLAVESAHHVRQALVVQRMELFGVRLPLLAGA